MLFKSGAKYEGFWANGRMNGKGMYRWIDGKRYEGEWVMGIRTGFGVTYYLNGEKHDGSYIDGKRHGSGWYKLESGKIRPGEWRNDELMKWTGPEQSEAQIKVLKLIQKRSK